MRVKIQPKAPAVSTPPYRNLDRTEIVRNHRSKRKVKAPWLATVIVQSNGRFSNETRFSETEQAVRAVVRHTVGNGFILFPGGWFSSGSKPANSFYGRVKGRTKKLLNSIPRSLVLSAGIDGKVVECALDQIAMAVSKEGVVALGRKFRPTKGEKSAGVHACNYLDKEGGQSRILEFNGDKYFLGVCYDSFGAKEVPKPPGISIVVDLVHQFQPKGKGLSGDVLYARHGFAGAAKAWKCLVFGAAVFFNRPIPENWPSGVRWTRGTMSTKKWKYEDNGIRPQMVKHIYELSEGSASIRIFNLKR